MGVFPQKPELNEPVTRAGFAAMLCEAASLKVVKGSTVPACDVDEDSWYAEALATLAQKEVMVGYPDGTFRPQQPVTGLEAGILAVRALGLPETVSSTGVDSPLDWNHWGSSVYSWLLDQGLVSSQANPEGHITVENAADFLARVFGCDEEAVAIVEKGQKSAATVEDMSFTGTMQMMMKPRAGAEAEMPLVQGSTQMTMEMILPDTLHQSMRMQFEGLPAGNGATPIPTMEMEQYLVDGSMYIKTVAPNSGETQWICLPGEALPDLKALMEESLQANIGVPEELRKYFHYQLLGTTEKNGYPVYEIGYYGQIDDFEAFFRSVLPESMRSLVEGALEEGIEEAGKMYKSISYWGKDYIGVDDNLSHASEVKMVMVFNDEFQGEPVPIELMEMYMRADKLEYNTGVKIELPLEALEAPEIPVPAESPAVPTA